MGEENENRSFKLFAELPDGSFSEIGPLVSAELTEAPPMEGYYSGFDLGSGKDECSISMAAQLSEEAVCLITGLLRSVLHLFSGRSNGKQAFQSFLKAWWPLCAADGKLSRKRFKKLLMAHGVSRNLAETAALTYNRCRVPYFVAYKEIVACTILRSFWPTEQKDE